MKLCQDVKESLLFSDRGEDVNTFNGQFCFDKGLNVFKGHFPNLPVLPGIMQIEMVRCILEKNTGMSYRISKVAKAKFNRPVAPGEIVSISISLKHVQNGSSEVKALLSVGGKPSAKIVATFSVN